MYGLVAGRLQAILELVSVRKLPGNPLERGLGLQRRQISRDRTMAVARAQPVDLGI